MLSIIEIEQKLAQNIKELQEHNRKVIVLTQENKHLHDLLSTREQVPEDAIVSRVLNVTGDWSTLVEHYEEARGAIKAAIADIANGCSYLRNTNIGCKQYSSWPCQRCDCRPLCGPRHGSIIASVGLVDPKQELTEEEQTACLIYLRRLLK